MSHDLYQLLYYIPVHYIALYQINKNKMSSSHFKNKIYHFDDDMCIPFSLCDL